MRNKFASYVCVLMLGGFVLSPVNLHAATDNAYRSYLLQIIDLLEEQIRVLQLELAAQTAVEDFAAGGLSEQVDMIAQHTINGLAAVDQIADRQKRAYFERVAELVPDEYDARFTRVGVYRGRVDFDAFVETIPPEHTTWLYATHEDFLLQPTAEWNTELIVHELAHVVSLDAVPGLIAYQQYDCTGELAVLQCPPADSYLGQFLKRFWEPGEIAAMEQARADGRTAQYYHKHANEFVSDYAATAPEEDFAETFMYYTLGKTASGKIAREKIAFFSDYEVFENIRHHVQAVK